MQHDNCIFLIHDKSKTDCSHVRISGDNVLFVDSFSSPSVLLAPFGFEVKVRPVDMGMGGVGKEFVRQIL